ncbi:hypothetical protein BJX70DRAFT_357431 [Aspergillus crustosus]
MSCDIVLICSFIWEITSACWLTRSPRDFISWRRMSDHSLMLWRKSVNGRFGMVVFLRREDWFKVASLVEVTFCSSGLGAGTADTAGPGSAGAIGILAVIVRWRSADLLCVTAGPPETCLAEAC